MWRVRLFFAAPAKTWIRGIRNQTGSHSQQVPSPSSQWVDGEGQDEGFVAGQDFCAVGLALGKFPSHHDRILRSGIFRPKIISLPPPGLGEPGMAVQFPCGKI